MNRLSTTMATSLGLLAAIGCLLCLPGLLHLTARDALVVELSAAEATSGPALAFSARYSEEGTSFLVDGEEPGSTVRPGLHHLQWQRSYGGGHHSRVGHTQLVGPFQDPSAPPCSVFLLMDQSFLDDGHAGSGTMAHLVKSQVEEELAGLSIWPLGDFQGVTELGLRWLRWDDQGESLSKSLKRELGDERALLEGHLSVELSIAFEDGKVPLELTMVPILRASELHFAHGVKARLKLDNRVYQWISNRFDGNDRVSQFVQDEIGKELIHILSTPPPIPLSGGAELTLEFCRDQQLGFDKHGFVALPLAVQIDDGSYLPPLHQGNEPPLSRALGAPIAIDMNENGLGAILHKLWSSGLLDDELARSLVPAFNEQETVRNFLSLRLDSAHFHLPPTLTILASQPPSLEVRATATLQIRDGSETSSAKLFTRIGSGLHLLEAASLVSDDLALKQLELTCVQGTTLRSCYTEILTQVRANQEPLQRTLAQSFQALLREVLVERNIGSPGTPGHFHLDHPSFLAEGGILRTELHGRVSATGSEETQ